MTEIEKLADTLDACVEDALRPLPLVGHSNISQMPDHRIICLANGLRAVAAALRAQGPTA